MRSAVPLGHKLIALILALAIAGGLFVELRRRATESANSAALSFDPVAAQQVNAAILHAAEPAVVLSQSILSDSVVTTLLSRETLASSATPIAVGEFRSRLDLTQPSPGILWVRYRDADPARATTITNSVAETLASWSPSGTTTAPPAPAPPPPAATHPAPTPRPAPTPKPAKQPAPVHTPVAKAPAVTDSPAPSDTLAAALGELQDQLSAAQRRVGGRGSVGYSPADGERQRYLEAQFRDVAQKLHDLRAQYGSQDPAAARHLAMIQEALVSGWAGTGRSAGLTNFHTAGTSTAQLSREKSQLAELISIVAEQRRAIERAEPARSEPARAEPAPTRSAPIVETPVPAPAPTPQPRAVQPPAADTAAQNPPAQSAPQSAPESAPAPSVVHPFTGEDNPLRLVRLAGPAGTVLWWPAVVAGCLCGLIYLAAVGAHYRNAEEPSDYVEVGSPQPGYRMITAAEQVPNGSRNYPTEAPPAAVVGANKRASFNFESNSSAGRTAAPRTASPRTGAPQVPVAAPAEVPVATQVPVAANRVPEPVASEPEPPIVQAPPAPANEPGVVGSEAARPELAESEFAGSEFAESELVGSELVASHAGETESSVHENVVQIADPWADELKKALSQTTLGRMLDDSTLQERETRSGQQDQESQRPPRSGRLAG